jgi:hypothetical protein
LVFHGNPPTAGAERHVGHLSPQQNQPEDRRSRPEINLKITECCPVEQKRPLPLPAKASEAWDWFHINAVHLDPSGNLIIDSRYTWAFYDVNRRTGKVLWQLGGKHSSFTEKAAPGQVLDSAHEIFAWQHDPSAVSNDVYTVFDDESDGDSTLLPYSRAVTIRLNFKTHVATLVKSENQPEGLGTSAFGSVQTTSDGDQFVGWGEAPFISEFSPSGKLLFNAMFPRGAFTYRAYLLPWHPAA